MNKEEKIYMFNEYVLGYDKGNNDRSCLTISKIISGDMYVMGSLYDGSADVISMIFDNLQQENKRLKEIEKEQLNSLVEEKKELQERLVKYQILHRDCEVHNLKNISKIEEMENQQKEFIEWLENGINQVRNTEFLDERIQRAGLVAYNRVLSKYKEIIGG